MMFRVGINMGDVIVEETIFMVTVSMSPRLEGLEPAGRRVPVKECSRLCQPEG